MDMNEDKLQFGEDGAPKMSDSYFENLYDDLPKEIADLLKSSHPFMEAETHEETLEEKRARRAAMRKEVKEGRKSAKGENTRSSFHFAEPVKEEAKEEPVMNEASAEEAVMEESADAPEFEQSTLEEVLASVYPELKVTEEAPEKEEAPVEEAAAQEPEEEVCEECVEQEIPVFDEEAILKKAMAAANIEIEGVGNAKEEPVKEEDTPVAEPKVSNKKAAFESFFNDDEDDYYDDEKGGILGKVVIIVLLILAIAAAVFFGMKYMDAQSKLSAINNQSAEIESYKAENESLKLQVTTLEDEVGKLEAEITALKAANNTSDSEEEDGTVTLPAPSTPTTTPTTPAAPTTTPSASSSTTYTVKDGDSYWGIAVKVYGDGTKYQKILDANGLRESDELSIGQTLKIPS